MKQWKAGQLVTLERYISMAKSDMGRHFPWGDFKTTTDIRDLTKVGALAAALIDKLQSEKNNNLIMEYKSIWNSYENEPIEGRYIIIKSCTGIGHIGTCSKRLNLSFSKGYEIGLKENSLIVLDGKYANEWCYYYDFCKNANIMIADHRLIKHKSSSYRENSIIETIDALIDRCCDGQFK